MEKKCNSNFWIVAVVAIVAIVAIIILFRTSSENTVSGQAYASMVGCNDADNGKDYYSRSWVTGTWSRSGEYMEVIDVCLKDMDAGYYEDDEFTIDNLVYEYFCDDGQLQVISYVCPNGCSDGACLR
ncbi:MAG: hypothetical protein PHE43_00075 [Candidatus Nanoarchaeia archaeon]|nr:hypothetical protein [Candidatus Nanoarchaeia archaeon]